MILFLVFQTFPDTLSGGVWTLLKAFSGNVWGSKHRSSQGIWKTRVILVHDKRRFVRTEGPSKPVSHFADSEFMGPVRDRISGRKLEDLIFVELFCGTAGLCAEVRRLGLSSSVGVDAHISKQTKSPVLRIDMTTSHGMDLVWRILQQDNCVACHLGPPCGTSSRARDIRRAHGPDPKPLRSETFPNGLPTLKNVDKRRVELANILYDQCARIFEYCCREGIIGNNRKSRQQLFLAYNIYDTVTPILQLL